jgi:hypothetical protein
LSSARNVKLLTNTFVRLPAETGPDCHCVIFGAHDSLPLLE